MNPEEEHIEDYGRLARYFAGESSPEETAWAEAWIAASEENQKIFDGLIDVWTLSQEKTQSVQTEVAWEKVKARTLEVGENHSGKVIPLNPEKPGRSWGRWLSYAAVLLIPLGLFIYLMFYSASKSTVVKFTTAEQPETRTLPDGSRVTLNAHSTLEYPETFDGDRRAVELKGEGFFEVEPDPNLPFYVHAGVGEVKVLGTSFNVKTKDRQVTVSVKTGKVRFAGRLDSGKIDPVQLEAGQSAVYFSDREKMEVETEEQDNFLFWKNHILQYEDTRLETVVAEISDFYPGKVKLDNPALANCRLTATYENKSLEELVELIAATFNLEISQDGKSYILKGEGCE